MQPQVKEGARAAPSTGEARYRQILETTPSAICIAVSNGNIAFVNSRWEQMFGYSRSEVLGRPLRDVLHLSSDAPFLAASESEHKLRRKDGSELWVRAHSSPVDGVAGEHSDVLAIFVGIAPPGRRSGAERPRAKLAPDPMNSLDTLAAGVAHEVNNPLGYVMANLEMLADQLGDVQRSAAPARVREWAAMVGEARHGAERIRQIVRSLRIFAGAGQGRREHLDVRQVIDIAANLALSQVRARARLVRDYGDVAVVLADDAQLAQVFMNLLVNAAQAIPEGQPDHHEIRISTHTGPLGRVVVEVGDTGSGMSPEVLARALDPFFTTKPVGGGVGLGLSFCRGVVGALGGELVIESAPGEGTLVRVSLPPAEMPAAPLADTALSPAPRQRILVVDEEPRVGNTLRWALKDHDIVIVTDARLALRRIEQGERYALILCDLMMPGMTGMDLHAALAIQCPTQAERTVFVTGGGLTPEAETFLKRASNVRLEKPFEPYQLRAVVRALATPLGVPGTD